MDWWRRRHIQGKLHKRTFMICCDPKSSSSLWRDLWPMSKLHFCSFVSYLICHWNSDFCIYDFFAVLPLIGSSWVVCHPSAIRRPKDPALTSDCCVFEVFSCRTPLLLRCLAVIILHCKDIVVSGKLCKTSGNENIQKISGLTSPGSTWLIGRLGDSGVRGLGDFSGKILDRENTCHKGKVWKKLALCMQFAALQASLTSSITHFGRSGRVTQNLMHMLTCVRLR